MTTFLKTHRHYWIAPLFIGVGLILLAAILLAPSSSLAPATPAAMWTPRSVTRVVGVGETLTVPVSFTASQDLDNVVVRIVPQLRPYVEIDPLMLGDIARGGTTKFNVVISPTASSQPQIVKGTIQLRSGNVPERTFLATLPVTVIIPDSLEVTPLAITPISSDETVVEQRINAYLGCTDFDCSDRLDAIVELGPIAVPRLIQLLESGPSAVAPRLPSHGTEIRLIAALGQLRDPRAIDTLRPFLAHSNPVVRAQAVTAISQIGGDAVVDTLVPALRDSDPLVREMAVRGLKHLGDPRAASELQKALEIESEPHIRKEIEETIRALK